MKQLLKNLLGRRVEGAIQGAFARSKEYSDEKAIIATAESVRAVASSRNFSRKRVFDLFYRINRTLYPEFVINDVGRLFLNDHEFRSYFERFSKENWTTFERRWNVKEILRQLALVPGDLAECGVYQGANAFLMCRFAQANGREVHLFDSWEGLSAPGENDGTYWAEGNLSATEELVHRNLEGFRCFKTFPGWIPEAFPSVGDRRYAFLHVDVDLEQPTYDSLAFFYPRMNEGGIIILDDHGYDTCPGARKAALDYMADKPEPVLDLSTGQGMIIKQK